jgi:hypothetical protein
MPLNLYITPIFLYYLDYLCSIIQYTMEFYVLEHARSLIRHVDGTT